jgi:tetratricopeptide (TPR) repeat protein
MTKPMMRLLALFLVAGITLAASSAAAGTTQSTTPAPPPSGSASTPPPPPPSTADQAREHYERGLAKYNLADFDAAIAEFKQSYELSKAPRLLFNLAQAHRLKKDYESALYFYNSYLRADPNPPNLTDVENRIDEMKRALDEQRKQPPIDKQPPPGKPVHVDRGPSKRTLKIMGLTVGTLGLVAAGVGGGMLGLASADSTKLKRVISNGWTWSSADDAIYREGDRAQTAGIALVSVGGALVLAGGVTLVLARRR